MSVTDHDQALAQTGFSLRASRLSILAGLAVLPALILADRSLMMAVQAWRWPALVEAMQVLTWLGYGMVDIAVPLGLALLGWWRGDAGLRVRGFWGAGTVALAGVVDQVLKNISCRARPSAPGAGTFFASFPCFPAPYAYASFPSGHATTAFATAVVLGLWFPRGASVFMGLAVLVGLSRVVLGAHFPSDVLAGALVGGGVALAVNFYVYLSRRREATAP